MASVVLRLLALITALLMPLGMSAAAGAIDHAQAQATMPVRHCPDQNMHHSSGAVAQCALACTSAMMPTDLPPIAGQLQSPSEAEPIPVHGLADIHLEIATPPPRCSA